MRTVTLTTNGFPVTSYIRDKESGAMIKHIRRIEFSDLDANDQEQWCAILHIYQIDEEGHQVIENDECVTAPEQVYMEVGTTE